MYHKIRGLDNCMKHSMTGNQMTPDQSLKFWICHVQSQLLRPNYFQTLHYMYSTCQLFLPEVIKLSGETLTVFYFPVNNWEVSGPLFVWGISRCGCYRSQWIYQDLHVPDCKHDIQMYILHSRAKSISSLRYFPIYGK